MPGTDAWQLSLATEGVFESRWALWTAFASSFVHTDPVHLVDNVVNYWLLVAVAYPSRSSPAGVDGSSDRLWSTSRSSRWSPRGRPSSRSAA